ncbi:MAG TPA: carboxylesterase family protein [Rhizomicrobium sp.]
MTCGTAARAIEGKPIVVDLPAGVLQGRSRNGIDAFVGIPYAHPAIGSLRWRAPQALPRWSGVRPATVFGNDCPQVRLPGDVTPSDQPMSEDCLTLNLWRPAGAKSLPVMVWIHGGGFVMGSSTSSALDGASLARRGVLLVSFNYRLGRFGFFAHPALTAEANGAPPANYAFLDMIAALKWVQRNIAAFGGDPHHVTIFGESAGGAAVNFLLASPQTRGLFAQAIVESGANREPYARLSQDRPGRISAEKAGIAFAKKAGLPDKVDAAALRALPSDAVQGNLSLFDMQADRFTGPVIDGRIVLADPIDSFATDAVPAVPYIIGSNGAELSQEVFAPAMIDFIEKQLPPAALADLKKAYGDPPAPKLIDDYFFGEAARGYARIMAARGTPTWLYRFDYVAEHDRATHKSANHASEIPFVFGNLPPQATAADRAVAQAMGDYWTNFAKSGNPNSASLPAWPMAGAGDPMLIVRNTGAEAAHDDDVRLNAILQAQQSRPR